MHVGGHDAAGKVGGFLVQHGELLERFGSGESLARVDADAANIETEQEIVVFPCGIAGFETCRGFVVLSAETAPLQWLSAVDGPPASFLVVDPKLRAPIVINPEAMIGLQVMPQDCVYPLRHVIVPAAEK